MSGVIERRLSPLPFCAQEALRYAGCAQPAAELMDLLEQVFAEVQDRLSYAVCYRELPLTLMPDGVDCGFGAIPSVALRRCLDGCSSVVVFAATVGLGLDRLLRQYSRLAPAKALLLQGIGAERVEALCDAFCDALEQEMGGGLCPRFSPGYGDLSLAVQRDIFRVLECPKRLGLTLNDSLLMSPSKSVTAFVGIKRSE